MHIDRDAPAVILDRNRLIGVDGDADIATVTSQCLVNRVIYDFKHHVVKSGAIVGIADVHAGTFAHRIKAFEYLDTG